MRRYLFLDIDGVLNSMRTRGVWVRAPGHDGSMRTMRGLIGIDPENVRHLNTLVAQSGATVILSSSWRLMFGVETTLGNLQGAGYAHDLAGATPQTSGSRGPGICRGDDIRAWLDEHGATAAEAVILDDCDDMGELLPRLVRTPVETGLTEEHVEQAMKLWGGAEQRTA